MAFMTHCYNSSCSAPSAGIASFTYTSAVQFFAAAQCLVSEGTYPDADVRDFSIYIYDFIIVGAGSSGSVVAHRLSKVAEWNILLIEAGGNPPIEAAIPGYHVDLYNTKYNWGYKTTNNGITNQANINGSFDWPRGKMIGGCSNLNAMIWMRGNSEDYQRWQNAGNPDWTRDDIHRCFKKAENFQDKNLLKIPNIRELYGHNGPLVINTFNLTSRKKANCVLSAWNRIGLGNVPDLNVANAFGSGIARATASDGTRNSISKAFLQPIKHRRNLTIMQNALVTKVLINNRDPLNKYAYGVLVEHNGKTIKILANKEVIISAGTINSPKLLMLSGIGPEKLLKAKGVKTVIDLPMVGQNLKEHNFMPVTIYTDEPPEMTEVQKQFDVIKYYYNRTGCLAELTYYDIFAFHALDSNAKYPDFQFYVANIPKGTPGLKHFLMTINKYNDVVADSIAQLNQKYSLYAFYVCHLHPHSQGNISLRSNDPKDMPLINPNYFSDSRDLELIVSGIEKLLEILNTEYFQKVKGFLGRVKWPACDKFKLGSRDYWKCLCVSLIGTVYHPVGTCKMGADLRNSVVSSRLIVHGVNNLRVIDASIMPNHVSGNTNGPCVMIGERGAEIIKEDYRKWKKS